MKRIIGVVLLVTIISIFSGCNSRESVTNEVDCGYFFENFDDYYDFIKTDSRLDAYRDKNGAAKVYELDTQYPLLEISSVSYGSYYSYKYLAPEDEEIIFVWLPTEDADVYLENSLDDTYINQDGFYYKETTVEDKPYFELIWVECNQYFLFQAPVSLASEGLQKPVIREVIVQK